MKEDGLIAGISYNNTSILYWRNAENARAICKFEIVLLRHGKSRGIVVG